MKRIVRLGTFLLFQLMVFDVYSQTITGNVIDGTDRGFLEKVWVVNPSNQDSSMTNERGYFKVRGTRGDSLLFSRPGFIPKKVVIGKDTHILVDVHLDARMLPRFDVYGEPIVIPFKAGNQSSFKSLTDRPAGPGKIYRGVSGNDGLSPGFTIDGPISYFMKSERQKREYARKLAFMARQEDYLRLIQSDSVMQALKQEFRLTDKDMDDLIIEFNLANINHQFLDMDYERVERMLINFLESRTKYRLNAPLQER